jgi:hypothetical protein
MWSRPSTARRSAKVGLYEFRIRWTAAEISHKVGGLPAADIGGAPEEILLRAFFGTGGRKIILLLSG